MDIDQIQIIQIHIAIIQITTTTIQIMSIHIIHHPQILTIHHHHQRRQKEQLQRHSQQQKDLKLIQLDRRVRQIQQDQGMEI